MFKIIIGFFAGMILAGALSMGPLSPNPVTGQSDDSTRAEPRTENAQTYHEIITSSLQAAGEEVQDKDIDQFYRKLIREYELDEPSSGIAQAEHSSPTDVLPDIRKINQKALILPLQEAGKNIKDKEIAQFYYKLLKDAGWAIEPD